MLKRLPSSLNMFERAQQLYPIWTSDSSVKKLKQRLIQQLYKTTFAVWPYAYIIITMALFEKKVDF